MKVHRCEHVTGMDSQRGDVALRRLIEVQAVCTVDLGDTRTAVMSVGPLKQTEFTEAVRRCHGEL